MGVVDRWMRQASAETEREIAAEKARANDSPAERLTGGFDDLSESIGGIINNAFDELLKAA